jgi:hypothetical protein
MPLHHLATVAVLGADTVVGSALCALLGAYGYRINPLETHPTGVDELLEGANLLLLVPKLDEDVREAFLGATGKSAPQNVGIAVISLCTTLEEGVPKKEGVISVPWPCETGVLAERIEAALAREGTEDAVAI